MVAKLTVKQIKQKLERLKGERATLDTQLQEVADYMLPTKNTVKVVRSPGQKRNLQILDGTGMYCLQLLAGQLHGLLTNPNAEWFEFTTGNELLDRQDDVRKFLQDAARQTHNVLNNSNFQTEVHEVYIDQVGFGTSAMYIEEDQKEVVRFSTKFIGEYWIDEDSRGRVNQLYREWKATPAQLVEQFGLDNVGKTIRDAYEKGFEEKHAVIHAVYPRNLIDPKDQSPLRIVSQYVLPEQDHELLMEGYREFPYVTPRWMKGTGEKYGTSPAMIALPDVKTVNVMTETIIIGAQKVVDPPLQLPDDGFILPIATYPGGLNFRRANSTDAKIEPLFNDSRIDFGFEATKEKRTRIREAFHVDQLMFQQGPQMTATEVLQRTEEKMRLLGPMLGRQQEEFLRPLIDRVFGIMMRRGIIKPTDVPASLKGKNIAVKYSSLIARSQKMNEGQNIMRVIQSITPFVQMDPSVADNFSGDDTVRILVDIFGAPQGILRDKNAIDQIRQQKAQAQQAALQQHQQQQNVDNMAKIAPIMQGQ